MFSYKSEKLTGIDCFPETKEEVYKEDPSLKGKPLDLMAFLVTQESESGAKKQFKVCICQGYKDPLASKEEFQKNPGAHLCMNMMGQAALEAILMSYDQKTTLVFREIKTIRTLENPAEVTEVVYILKAMFEKLFEEQPDQSCICLFGEFSPNLTLTVLTALNVDDAAKTVLDNLITSKLIDIAKAKALQ